MRVLLIEDNDGDADLVTDALSAAVNADVELERVVRLRDATERLATDRFDVVLLDLTLPDAMNFEGLTRLRGAAPSAPIVVLTGHRDPAKGIEAIQLGAQDYLQKGQAQGAELLRVLRFARERAQYAERAQLLSEVSVALGSSLDPLVMLRAVATVIEGGFADELESGNLRQTDDAAPVGSGSPVAHASRPAQLSSTLDAIVVPVRARGMLEGTLRFTRRSPARPYGPLDVSLAEEIARRIVAAIEYADLVAVAHRDRERAEVAGRVRDEFLATLSHELRTPLTSILGWAQLLRAENLSEAKRTKAYETIERNAHAQVALIEDVLDVSRIITGKLRLKVGDVALAKTLPVALESVLPAATSKGVAVELVVDTPIPTVQGDPDRLLQVFWNLLSNAVKYTPRGGRVQVRASARESFVTVVVVDTGAGIAAEVMPHIFERFWQVDSSITRAHGGLGLGLAITRHLVELQGGDIVVESPGLGRGSTFTVRLPVAVTAGTGPRSVAPPPEPSSPSSFRPSPALAQIRVLVVEDDDDTRELMTVMLGAMGATVSTAASAREGLAVLAAGPQDVIVSDIGMSEQSGYMFMESVRRLSSDAGGRTPSLALTAYAREDDRARVFASGFDEHLSKPTEPALLSAAVLRLAALSSDR